MPTSAELKSKTRPQTDAMIGQTVAEGLSGKGVVSNASGSVSVAPSSFGDTRDATVAVGATVRRQETEYVARLHWSR